MKLSIVRAPVETVHKRLGRVSAWTINAGLESMADMVANSEAFNVLDVRENVIGHFCLQAQQLPAGKVCWLVAGQGRAINADLTRELLPEIEKNVDADYFAIQTLRPGLVKKLISQGYELGGHILVKKLK